MVESHVIGKGTRHVMQTRQGHVIAAMARDVMVKGHG